MIIHIIPGDFDHLTLDIINAINKHSNYQHYFILPTFQPEKKLIYHNYFQDNSQISYLIIDESYATSFYITLSFLLGHRGGKLKQEAAILRVLFKNRKLPIISHFYFKSMAILPIFKKYIWICWGNIPKYRNLNLRNRFKLFILKWLIVPKIEIITLMDSDKEVLTNNFNGKDEKIRALSYMLDNYSILLKTGYERIINDKTKVLIGNNSNHLQLYYKALDYLHDYKEKITLSAMLSYGRATSEEIEDFTKNATKIFGDNFESATKFYKYPEYVNWLRQFDVYICNSRTQSGLGLIYIMIYLGKKVFLEGHNLEWCISNSLIVFKTNSLLDNEHDFSTFLSNEQISQNRKKVSEMLDTSILSKKWDVFFKSII